MRAMVRLSVSSSTRTPVRSASCNCRLARIIRSSTCFSRVASGGSGARCCCNCCLTVRRRLLSSVRVMTSLFTTATMDSSGCRGAAGSDSAAWRAAGSNSNNMKRRNIKMRSLLSGSGHRRGAGAVGAVAKDSMFQHLLDRVADGGEPFQLELEIQRLAAVAFDGIDVTPAGDAEGPAAAVVLYTGQGFERAVVPEAIIPAADQPPLPLQRPQHGKIGLVDVVGAEAVTGVEDVAGVALIMELHAAFLDLLVGVPLQIAGGGPRGGEAGPEFGDDVRFAAHRGRLARQGDSRRLDIIDLAEGGAQPLAAAVAFEQAAGAAGADLIGVAEPVGGGVTVLAEQLRIAEIISAGIEYRKVALIAIGDAEIIKARLQRVHIGQAAELEFALEEDAAVDAQHRRGMAGRGLAAGGDGVEIIAGVVEAETAVEVGGAGAGQAAAELAEILGIGYVIEIGVGVPARGQRVMMLLREGAAVAAVDGVAGQVIGGDAAGVVRIEIAEFELGVQAAGGQQARRNGGVAVGGDVPVERHAQFEPAQIAVTDGGRQQAGLAVVVERKIDVGQVEQRHVLEAHGDAAGHAHRRSMVESDAAGAQFPVEVVGIAGGVGGAVELSDVGALAHQRARVTVGMAFEILIMGAFDLAGLGRKIEMRGLSFHDQAAMTEVYRAGGVDQPGAVVVHGMVGGELGGRGGAGVLFVGRVVAGLGVA